MSPRIVIAYFGTCAAYGFYRGYNNLFYYNDDFNVQEKLLVDRVSNGFIGSFIHINPLLQPVLYYGLFRRFEKTILNMRIDQSDYKY